MSVQSQDLYATAGVPLTVVGSGGGGGVYPANGVFSTITLPSGGTITGTGAALELVGVSTINGAPFLPGNVFDTASISSLSVSTITAVNVSSMTATLGSLNLSSIVADESVNFNNGDIINVSSINGYDAQSLPYSYRITPIADLIVPAGQPVAISSLIVAPFPVIHDSQYQLSGQLFMSTTWVPGGTWGETTAKIRLPGNTVNTIFEWIDTGVSYNYASTLRGGGLTPSNGAYNFTGTFTSGPTLTSTFVTLYVPNNIGGPQYSLFASSIYGLFPAFPNGWAVTDLGTLYPTPPLV